MRCAHSISPFACLPSTRRINLLWFTFIQHSNYTLLACHCQLLRFSIFRRPYQFVPSAYAPLSALNVRCLFSRTINFASHFFILRIEFDVCLFAMFLHIFLSELYLILVYTLESTGPATLFRVFAWCRWLFALWTVWLLWLWDVGRGRHSACIRRRSSNVSTSAWRVKTHAELNWTAPHPIFSIESIYST